MKSLNSLCSEDFDLPPQSLTSAIFMKLATFRRMIHTSESCHSSLCQLCTAPHLHKMIYAIKQEKPILFVLPAFPGKSPNPEKVLGPLPDMAEQKALQFLNHLCNQIKDIYSPGAHLLLCSDGRVFSDIIGIREEDVTAYQDELEQMIHSMNLTNISTYKLDDLWGEQDFSKLRKRLMDQHGESLDSLRERVQRGGNGSKNPKDQESHRIYCGITRFLVEDALTPNQTISRNKLQKESRIKAYEVIRRSNAWSSLIESKFPHAVRLSIHPQTCGSSKLGLKLLDSESWMTPWHGVAVEMDHQFVIMKRWEAENLKARLVYDVNGRASHYKLEKSFNDPIGVHDEL